VTYYLLCLTVSNKSVFNTTVWKALNEQIIVHHQEEFCTSSLQYITVNIKSSLVVDTIRMNIGPHMCV